jgi:uncharacterized protein YjiK
MFVGFGSHYSYWMQRARMKWLFIVVVILLLGTASVRAQLIPQPVYEVRTLYPSNSGIEFPIALSYSNTFKRFYSLVQPSADQAPNSRATVVAYTAYDELIDTTQLAANLGDSANLAFDDVNQRLFLLNSSATLLVQLKVDQNGRLDPTTEVSTDISGLHLSNVVGMAIDNRSEKLLFLDGAASQLLRINVDQISDGANIERFDLAYLGAGDLRGLAVHPVTGHPYLLSPAKQALYELDESAQLVAEHEVSSVALSAPRTLVFASSSDLTDSADTIHLFIANKTKVIEQPNQEELGALPYQIFLPLTTQDDASGSHDLSVDAQKAEFDAITEVTFEPSSAQANIASTQATRLSLVQAIDSSAYSPPSPDPSGITYISSEDTLLVVDGEVDEMPALFTGNNVFGVARTGTLSYVKTTLPWSYEPTDVAYNPTNGYLFYSNDSKKMITEVNPGPDGVHGTGDDSMTSFLTSAFNSMDPEGVAYDPGSGDLFIADGVNSEVYRVNRGANGIFDGVSASGGDDVVTNFDTLALGIEDPEGIEINTTTGNLILTGRLNVLLLYEVTQSGNLVNTFDVSASNGHKLAGVTIAPGSTNPAIASYYIVDRGIDNNSDPNENDGRIYEFSSDPSTPMRDAIFADSFESGNLSLWSTSNTDNGDLSVSPAAALVGGQGLQAVINDNNLIFLTDNWPSAEPRYRARFYFDPNSIAMANADAHYIFQGYSGNSTLILRVEFRYSGGVYQIRAALLNDAATWSNSGWFTLSDAPHYLELDWQAATAVGANDGALAFWIDGVQQAGLTGIDNDTYRIDRARLGAVAGVDTGTRGTYYFDAFESRRQTYIGPATVVPTATPTNTPVATNTPIATDVPSATPTDTPTNTPITTDVPSVTPTDTPTNTPMPTNTPTATNTPTVTNTPTATNTPTVTNTPTATNTPKPTRTPKPTNTPRH